MPDFRKASQLSIRYLAFVLAIAALPIAGWA